MQLSRAEKATLAAVQAGQVTGGALSEITMPAELVLDGVTARVLFGLLVNGLVHTDGTHLSLTPAGQRALFDPIAVNAADVDRVQWPGQTFELQEGDT